MSHQLAGGSAGVRKLVCENWCAKTGVRKLVCDRTFDSLCFESEMNIGKGWGIT